MKEINLDKLVKSVIEDDGSTNPSRRRSWLKSKFKEYAKQELKKKKK